MNRLISVLFRKGWAWNMTTQKPSTPDKTPEENIYPRRPPEVDKYVDTFLSLVCDTSRRYILELLAIPRRRPYQKMCLQQRLFPFTVMTARLVKVMLHLFLEGQICLECLLYKLVALNFELLAIVIQDSKCFSSACLLL